MKLHIKKKKVSLPNSRLTICLVIGHRLSPFGETLSTVAWPPSCQSHGDVFIWKSCRPIKSSSSSAAAAYRLPMNKYSIGQHKLSFLTWSMWLWTNRARKANVNVNFLNTLTWALGESAFTLESWHFPNSVWDQWRDWASNTKQDHLCSDQSFWTERNNTVNGHSPLNGGHKASMAKHWRAQCCSVCALSLRGVCDALGRNTSHGNTLFRSRGL